MFPCNIAFEQCNLELRHNRNAFIIIIIMLALRVVIVRVLIILIDDFFEMGPTFNVISES